MLITIFDKSFIHAISVEEAAVFDMHFMSNITPLFFVEVLGDLEKVDVTEPHKRAALIKSLATKTPDFRSYPNVSHTDLMLNELLGHEIEMRGRPHIGGGKRIQNDKGLGTIFDEAPEMRAKNRWHNGHFEEQEYALAKAWREMLAANPMAMEKLIKGTAGRFSFRDYAAIKAKADEFIDKGSRLIALHTALEIARIPPRLHSHILVRWKGAGGPPLREFAPYTAFCLSVDLFRVLAMGSGHMSWEKSSNYVDLAYLYYLPFCQVFISTDKIHRHTVPLFMNPIRQAFVWGPDLRAELAILAAEYMAAPDIEEVVLIGVAGRKTFDPAVSSVRSTKGFIQGRLLASVTFPNACHRKLRRNLLLN